MNNEAILLADTFQKVRDLTRWYFSLLKNADPYMQWETNGQKLNSAAWLAAHLVWAEDFLIVKATGGKGFDLPWLDNYKLGSAGNLHEDKPDMKYLLDLLKQGHENAHAHLLSLTDEKMGEENAFGFGFGGVKTNRMMVQHCIRHEGMHAGHLSWLCKIKGVASV
ncbi:MAG TPA: DinB family protein [Chitinophagales bacterium]|nr:DinB family protein [Chitinophagales bacterium]